VLSELIIGQNFQFKIIHPLLEHEIFGDSEIIKKISQFNAVAVL